MSSLQYKKVKKHFLFFCKKGIIYSLNYAILLMITGDEPMKKIGRYAFILFLMLLFWDSIVMQPLKVFSLYLHQISHFLTAISFSYNINEFNISFYDSSYTLYKVHSWGSAFVIANAGYIGGIIFSLLIFHFKHTYVKRYLLGSVALVFLLFTINYTGLSYQLIYCALFSTFVVVLYMLNNEKLNDWVIDIVGVSSIAFGIYDTAFNTIFYYINQKAQIFPTLFAYTPFNDSFNMEKLTGVPSIVWGAFWLVANLVLVYFIFTNSKKKEAS